MNSLQKHFNQETTTLRKEYERIFNEIQYKYKFQMKLLREAMEKKRKKEIEKIEQKKQMTIEALKEKHEKKYTAIKTFYLDITATNFDIIKGLKEDLASAKKDDAQQTQEKIKVKEKNEEIQGPLDMYS